MKSSASITWHSVQFTQPGHQQPLNEAQRRSWRHDDYDIPYNHLVTAAQQCPRGNHNLKFVTKCQITRLQVIQNSLARAVVKAPKSSHITPILRTLHWLKITERIEYKLLSLTYKVLTTTQPSYLHNLITVQPPRSSRSSSLVTLARPSTSSSLRITDRSFQYASPRLWNQLPALLRQPRTNLSNSASPSFSSGTSSISSIDSPLFTVISEHICFLVLVFCFYTF